MWGKPTNLFHIFFGSDVASFFERIFRIPPNRQSQEQCGPKKHRDSAWFEFWKNLKEGYKWFEKYGLQTAVWIYNTCYVFAQCQSQS